MKIIQKKLKQGFEYINQNHNKHCRKYSQNATFQIENFHQQQHPFYTTYLKLSVNAQTTTATAPPGVSYLQPPYAAIHHDAGCAS